MAPVSGTLVAGPYLGEFGWEACAWVPRVRCYSREFAQTVVLAPAASAPLYEFADRFVPVEPAPFSSNFALGDLAGSCPIPAHDAYMYPAQTLVNVESRAFSDPSMRTGLERAKEWRSYGTAGRRIADVCLALRPPKLYRGMVYPEREWPQVYADQLALMLRSEGLTVASIGGLGNYCAEGTLDLRGRPLGEQLDALRRALVAAGPSSGPLHVAQLCGCPVVTWYNARPAARQQSQARYASLWNPFGAPFVFLADSVPTSLQVAGAAVALCRSELRAAEAGTLSS